MKFSLSSLLFLVTLVAMALGWWLDHERLQTANTRLNTESSQLFADLMMERHGGGFPIPAGERLKFPARSIYDFSDPEHRAEYRENFGHIGRKSR